MTFSGGPGDTVSGMTVGGGEKLQTLQGIRIIIMLRSLGGGGSQTQALNLARVLRGVYGADVRVWAFDDDPAVAALLEEAEITREIIPSFYTYPRFRKVLGLARFILRMRRFRPDVILPFNNLPNKICCSVWKLTGARVCPWSQRDEGRDVDGSFLEKMALRHTQVFISNSTEGRDFLVKRFAVDPGRIEIIYNGTQLAPPRRTPDQWRERLEAPPGSLLVVKTANLTRFKDHETLLAAWRITVREVTPLLSAPPLLILAGRKLETYERLREITEAWGLAPYVRFTGFVDDVSGLLGAAALGVFSSVNEGCPNGVLEYMAAGLPVVAADIAGTRDALGTDYPFLVPARDPKKMSEKLTGFLTDVYSSGEWGERNRRRAEEFFSVERLGRDYERFLSQWTGRS